MVRGQVQAVSAQVQRGRITTSSTGLATSIPSITTSLSISLTSISIHRIMGSSGQGDQAVEVAAVQRHGQGDRDQDHGDGA